MYAWHFKFDYVVLKVMMHKYWDKIIHQYKRITNSDLICSAIKDI